MRLHRLLPLLAVMIAALLLNAAAPARAELQIAIDKAAQRMTVSIDGEPLYEWPVSTGRRGHDTPDGTYTPFRMERDHFSREWDDAPMPHSIFFTQAGHAIHGTYDQKNLGRPASHGCVRLSRANAATLWALVKQQGKANTTVSLTGVIPASTNELVARREQGATNADDDVTGSLPPRRQRTARGARDYQYGARSYYYRAQPSYYGRRNYGYGLPFFLPFGR